MRIAFLGLGQMGSAMAKLLMERGYNLTVWNRTAAAASSLEKAGAAVAATPAFAVAGAEIVFTMVHDDSALESILFEQGTLAAIASGAAHISLSTISVALADRLDREHADRQQKFIASPVFGRPNVAAEGKLWLAIAGKEDVVTPLLPVLATFSRGYTLVGDTPSAALAVKLGGNFLITAMIASLSEGMVFANAHGVAPEVYLEAINSALFQSPFYANYGKVMLHPPEQPGATVELGIKDTQMFREAAKGKGTRTPLADLFQQELQAARVAGLGAADWAAGYYQQVRNEARGIGAK